MLHKEISFNKFYFFNFSGIPDLLARCKEIWRRVRRWPDHPDCHVTVLVDQCIFLCIPVGPVRNRFVPDLQERSAGSAKDLRGTSFQV